MAGRVPLKFGHNPDQPFTDGQPALGWVARLWREGAVLFGDLTSMPRTVYEAIKDGLYKFVSVELLRDVAYDGKEFPWVLSAVALLGADIPAVRGLKDLQALAMSRRVALRSGARVTFTRDVSTSTGDRTAMADETKSLEALTARLDALSGKVEAFSAENATLKADNARLTKEAEDREAGIKAEKVATHRAAIALRFKTAIDGKLIYPRAQTLFEKNPAFASDDGVLAIKLEDVDGYIKDNTIPGVKFTERKTDGGTDSRGDDSDEMLAADEVNPASFHVLRLSNDRLANDQRYKGADFFTASQSVLKDYPKLADKYRHEPGTVGGRP